MRRIDQLAIIAVTAVAGVGALFGTAATFAAQDKPSTTRDPDLPETPRQIADLFIADSYLHHSRGGKTSPYVDWFCEPDEAPRKEQKDCPITSRSAFNQLIGGLTSPDLRPQLLRAGKARDDCLNRSKARCSTGVPPPETCSAPADLPFCALQELKRRGINLGVVIGARNSTTGRPRPIKDLAWQACRIHAADKDSGFYDFLFLDLANELGRDLTAAVKYINEGKVFAGGDVSKARNWDEGEDCKQGWDVITNDNGWDTGKNPQHPLDTQAWGHAKNYEVAASFQTLERAASKGGQAITNADRSFIDHVNRLNPPGRLTTGAVLRVEVTKSTGFLQRLTPEQQCRVLGRWANAQMTPNARFASLFPLYNHGDTHKKTLAYNSFAQGTFQRQLALIANPENPVGTCPSDPADPALSDGDNFSSPLTPPASTPLPPPPPPPPPPAPVVRPPDAGSYEPTNLTCHSARLNGWVNAHGSATTYHFEYWKTGDQSTAQSSGFGNVGAGTDRVPVARVVDGLQRKTQYTGKLMASNAGGRGVSEIFSFTTPGC